MAKKCKCDCPAGLPLWIGTFGDLMSLLLTFFVLLLSMASFDAKKLSEAEAAMYGTLSILEGGSKLDESKDRFQQPAEITEEYETTDEVRLVKNVIIEYNEMQQTSRGPSAVLEEGDEGFTIHLPAKTLFESGSATIKDEDALLFLRRMTQVIAKLPSELMIHVSGHTDDLPPRSGSLYRDNWDLSAYRSVAVSRVLIGNGVDPTRISACGHGEYKPIATNATPEGREKNRRVDIQFLSLKKEEAIQKSILDK